MYQKLNIKIYKHLKMPSNVSNGGVLFDLLTLNYIKYIHKLSPLSIPKKIFLPPYVIFEKATDARDHCIIENYFSNLNRYFSICKQGYNKVNLKNTFEMRGFIKNEGIFTV